MIALVALVMTATPSTIDAQVPPVEISAVQYGLDGRVSVLLRLPPGTEVDGRRLTTSVDGTTRTFSVLTPREQDSNSASIMVAVDVSDGMSGVPIDSARRAIVDLADALQPADRLGVIAFADTPQLVVPLTTDRSAVVAAANSLGASGRTALYDAVRTSSDALSSAPAPKAIVLLSNAPLRKGEEVGGVSSTTRAASIAAARASGARVYAYGLGADPDREYLMELATTTQGAYQQVADTRTLSAVLAAAGTRLASSHAIDIAVPLLSTGRHEVRVRGTIGGRAVNLAQTFDVTNSGLLSAELVLPETAQENLRIRLQSPAPLADLGIEAVAGDRALEVIARSGEVVVDPWLFTPGPLPVRIVARVNGTPAEAVTVEVTIPQLPAQLAIESMSDGVRVRGRMQAETGTLIVRLDGVEQARAQAASLEIPLSRSGDVTAELVDSRGVAVQSQSLRFQKALPRWQFAAGAIAVVSALVGWVLLRNRRRGGAAGRDVVRRATLGARGASQTERGLAIVVRGPTGEHTYQLGRTPLSVGSAPTCDIVLPGDDVRAVHARVTLLPGRQAGVRGVGADTTTSSPQGHVVQCGGQFSVGTYTLAVYDEDDL